VVWKTKQFLFYWYDSFEAQRLRFYYIGRRFYPVIPKPVLVIVDMPDFDFSYMSEEDQERCLNCFNFFNFALVVYMKILQYCFQSYFNLHRHHWGRVASINNIGFACCNIFNFSWFCRTNFLWSFTFHVFIFFLDHESPKSISGADKPVTSSTCKLTSSSSCRPPKPALDDNEIC